MGSLDRSSGVSGPNLKMKLAEEHHSQHSAERSSAYHSKNVDPMAVRHSEVGSLKMTRAEGRPQSLEDADELEKE